MTILRIALFAGVILFCLTPWASPPIALALGVTFALTLGHPAPRYNSRATRVLLQTCVVGLGFGINLQQVLTAGHTGFFFTVVSIVATLVAGFGLGKLLGVDRTTAHLISSGTAICGGSTIAAVGPVLGATDEEMSVSLGTVFILNAVALFLFPPIGTALHLTQTQFGLWSGIAIHDTSSVVGAASKYGAEALQIATPVKLARALWIVPLTLVTALLFRKPSTKIVVPWFIGAFLVASLIRTYVSAPELWAAVVQVARIGLTLTLFLIGAGMSRRALVAVGPRPLILGVLLWIAVSIISLYAVMATVA